MLDWVRGDCEDGGETESKNGRCGDWDTDARKFEVRISMRNASGGSAASAQRLRPGLALKASIASLSEVF